MTFEEFYKQYDIEREVLLIARKYQRPLVAQQHLMKKCRELFSSVDFEKMEENKRFSEVIGIPTGKFFVLGAFIECIEEKTLSI